MQTRIILAAVAVLSIATTAPAEARRHQPPQYGGLNATIDVAAIPAYPIAGQVKMARVFTRTAARKRPVVMASLSPSDVSQGSLSLPPTLNGYRDRPAEHPTAFGLVTVPTAAGINITVAADFAPKAQAVIADAEAQGIHLTRIRCYSATGHARNSNHHAGRACDTRPYIPATIVRANGLRSGRDFHDPEHFDDATNVGGMAYWNSVKHRGQTVTASSRSYHHRRIRIAGR